MILMVLKPNTSCKPGTDRNKTPTVSLLTKDLEKLGHRKHPGDTDKKEQFQ